MKLLVPQLCSERGIGFLLDVANQHGDGALKSMVEKVSAPGCSERDLLLDLREDGTVEGGLTIFEVAKGAFAGAILEGVLMVVMLSISLETFSDDLSNSVQIVASSSN